MVDLPRSDCRCAVLAEEGGDVDQQLLGDLRVTDAMLDELWRRMQQRGIRMDRLTYDDAAEFVRRRLGVEIARYVFGAEAEFLRVAQTDAAIQAAVELARGARTQRELFERAEQRRERSDGTGATQQ